MKTQLINEYEVECFARVKRLMAKRDMKSPIICDVGGNVGQSIELFRQCWPDSIIHSFEPNPSVFGILESKWGDANGVTLQQLALSTTIGTVPFYATRIPEVASMLRPTDRMRKLSVEKKYDYDCLDLQSDTLDHYCQTAGISDIDLLKIDVQGAELSVLGGAKSLIERGAISLIYVESIFADCYEGQTQFAELLTYLGGSEDNYQLWDVMPFLYTSKDRVWAVNSIFLSKSFAESL